MRALHSKLSREPVCACVMPTLWIFFIAANTAAAAAAAVSAATAYRPGARSLSSCSSSCSSSFSSPRKHKTFLWCVCFECVVLHTQRTRTKEHAPFSAERGWIYTDDISIPYASCALGNPLVTSLHCSSTGNNNHSSKACTLPLIWAPRYDMSCLDI